jgi:hypothetical protein
MDQVDLFVGDGVQVGSTRKPDAAEDFHEADDAEVCDERLDQCECCQRERVERCQGGSCEQVCRDCRWVW